MTLANKDGTIGTPPNSDQNYVEWCPQCGRRLNPDDNGYGFAYGGGIGWYIYCNNPACDWFYKQPDQREV